MESVGFVGLLYLGGTNTLLCMHSAHGFNSCVLKYTHNKLFTSLSSGFNYAHYTLCAYKIVDSTQYAISPLISVISPPLISPSLLVFYPRSLTEKVHVLNTKTA